MCRTEQACASSQIHCLTCGRNPRSGMSRAWLSSATGTVTDTATLNRQTALRHARKRAQEGPEAAIRRRIVKTARRSGWRVYSTPGFGMPVSTGDPGFPDLFCVRDGQLLAVACKSQRGYVSPRQRAWLDDLNAAGVQAVVVRPWRPKQSDACEAIGVAECEAILTGQEILF